MDRMIQLSTPYLLIVSIVSINDSPLDKLLDEALNINTFAPKFFAAFSNDKAVLVDGSKKPNTIVLPFRTCKVDVVSNESA